MPYYTVHKNGTVTERPERPGGDDKADTLYQAASALLERIDNMTTEEFSKGGERSEREALRRVLCEHSRSKSL